MLVALANGLGMEVLRSMTSIPTAVAELGTPVCIITSYDGLEIGVLRSMTPPTAFFFAKNETVSYNKMQQVTHIDNEVERL